MRSPVKKFLRAVWAAFKVLYFLATLALLGAIGYAAYLMHPLYMEPITTVPEAFYPDDKISWTFRRYPENEKVLQRVTLYHDGRNEIVITREPGDYDIDMLGPLLTWQPRRDHQQNLIVFSRRNLIPRARATAIFMDTVKAGVLDIQDETFLKGSELELEVNVGLESRTVRGPDFLHAAPAYPPKKWINRTRWQKIAAAIEADSQIKPLMAKVKYIKNVEAK